MTVSLLGLRPRASGRVRRPIASRPRIELVGSVVSLLALVGLWEAYSRLRDSPFVPTTGEIVSAWTRLWDRNEIAPHVQESVMSAVQGISIAIVLGVAVGVAMARIRVLDVALRPYVDVFLAAPLVAVVPVFAMILSTPRQVVVATVILYCVFDILENARMGALGTPKELIEMARSFGVSSKRVFMSVILPSALHLTMTGIGNAVSKAFKAVLIGEMLITVVGLGGRIRYYGAAYRVPELYALAGTTIVLAVLASTLIGFAAKRLSERFPAGSLR